MALTEIEVADKAVVTYIISTIREKVTGWLQGYVSDDELKDLLSLKANTANPEFTGIPTAPTAASGNSSGQLATTEFVQLALNSALAGITGVSMEVVDVLPETGERGTFYFVRRKDPEENNASDEYVWLNNKWEFIGTSSIDLSGYIRKDEIVAIPTEEIDAMFADW